MNDEHCRSGTGEAGLHQACADGESRRNATKTSGPFYSRSLATLGSAHKDKRKHHWGVPSSAPKC